MIVLLDDNEDADILPFIDDDSDVAAALRAGVLQHITLSVWFSGKLVPAAKC